MPIKEFSNKGLIFKILYSVCFTLFSLTASAQIDSLLKVARSSDSMGEIEDLHTQIINRYKFSQQYDKAVLLSDSIIAFYQKNGEYKHLYNSLGSKASLLISAGRLSEASQVLDVLDKKLRENKDEIPLKTKYAFLSTLYTLRYELTVDESNPGNLEDLYKATALAKKGGHSAKVDYAALNIAYNHLGTNTLDSAAHYFEFLFKNSTIDEYKEIGRTVLTAVYLRTEEYEKAMQMIQVGNAEEEANGNLRNVLINYNILLKILNGAESESLDAIALRKTGHSKMDDLLYKIEILADTVEEAGARMGAYQGLNVKWLNEGNTKNAKRLFAKYRVARDSFESAGTKQVKFESDAKYHVQEAEQKS